MKRNHKIILWITGIVLTLVIGVCACLNPALHYVATRAIDQALAGNDSLQLTIGDIHLSVRNGYIQVNDVHVQTGVTEITAEQVRAYRDGHLYIGQTHIHNTVDKWENYRYHNPGPNNWIDLTLRSVRTSPIDIQALRAGEEFKLDSIIAEVEQMNVFCDRRVPSPVVIPMPQELIRSCPTPFLIRNAVAKVDMLHVEFALTDHNCGYIDLKRLTAKVKHITPAQDATIAADIHTHIGSGQADIALTLKLDEQSHWTMDMVGREVEMSALNSLIYPLVAIRIGGQAHELRTRYAGDNKRAQGTFCLQYDRFQAHVEEDVKPAFPVIGDLAEIINSVIRTSVPKANPKKEGKQPLQFNVKKERNEYKTFPIFLTGPLVDGCVKTLLPGLFISSQIKAPKHKHDSDK